MEEQGVYVKMCVILWKTFTKIYKMSQKTHERIDVAGHNAINDNDIGQSYTKDNPRIRPPSTSADNPQVEEVNALIHANDRFNVMTLRKISTNFTSYDFDESFTDVSHSHYI
ncbi:hypothetical protein AVEN_99601-1 [Araneus ventricosus]|uniref:Uncharacterized protein n=1 Tax=Araneus ventricosus TaxID=182803 RepID=A0A4Y2EQ74_ARAVE|nr:hypothetical protein AVEN_99601-1 [Araneus ventricosus]